MLSSEKKDIFKLEKTLKAKIIGQDYAISEIIRALKRSALDLQDANRPIASFLFAGTTGVGKTETAKVLANEYFEDPKALVRFDMSEYQTQETVQRLIGSAPGYVGYNEGGQLTNAVKNRPYCVVLFDEIEKAHPDVLNILLQILDEGKVTDAHGRAVNFENTVIVVSHDRYFLNTVVDKVLVLDENGITEYLGNYDYYIEKKKQVQEMNTVEVVEEKTKTQLKEEKRKEREQREAEKKNRVKRQNIEKEIEETEAKIEEMDVLLCQEEVYSNPEKSKDVSLQKASLEEKLSALYEEWESLM